MREPVKDFLKGPSTGCTSTDPLVMVDPPYLIDLIDLIRSGCPFSAILSLYALILFGKSPNLLCNVRSDVIHAPVPHMQETAPEVLSLYAERTQNVYND